MCQDGVVKASLSMAGRDVGTVTLEEDNVVVDVADTDLKIHLEQLVRETGDFTFAWTGRDGAPGKPSVAQPNTETWLIAILIQKLAPEGYRFTLDSA